MREDELYSRGVFASELDDDLGDDIDEKEEEEDADIDEDDLYDDDFPEDDEDGNYNPMDDYRKDGWE